MAELSKSVLGAAGWWNSEKYWAFCKFLVSRAFYTIQCLLSQLLLYMYVNTLGSYETLHMTYKDCVQCCWLYTETSINTWNATLCLSLKALSDSQYCPGSHGPRQHWKRMTVTCCCWLIWICRVESMWQFNLLMILVKWNQEVFRQNLQSNKLPSIWHLC